jgi:putative phage-type endonuclease
MGPGATRGDPVTAANGRRVGAARLVLPADAPDNEWLDARRTGIGSSDAPLILGLFPSPLRVFLDKRGELPPEDRESTERQAVRMRMGRRWEGGIAEEWTMRNQTVTRRQGLVANINEPWRMATVDRRVAQCPLDRTRRNACSLEIKLTGVFNADKWRREVPDSVLAQVMHSMSVTSDDHQHVAVMIGTGEDYRQFVVYRDGIDRPVYDLVTDEVARYWTEHLVAGVAPPVSDDEGDLFDRMHPDRDGVKQLGLDDSVDAREAIEQYRRAHAAAVPLIKAKKAAKTRLIGLLGAAEVAVDGDRALYSYPEANGQRRCDFGWLLEHHPDIYRQCVSQPTHRTLSVPGMRSKE